MSRHQHTGARANNHGVVLRVGQASPAASNTFVLSSHMSTVATSVPLFQEGFNARFDFLCRHCTQAHISDETIPEV